eukprot:CAMPEP_0169137486 /NCGR_PEP_ID=MMETSP1015-20121227/41572_1 /TAXON_ID=342587 /ORGANISM="Karlodinium micrum, Strain CCMP2283" /LENGTH=99 /DNA_ID=CAMNT_0009202349 /DNA_START=200 /DNA_END=499 /DNA_ORIENTATION=-
MATQALSVAAQDMLQVMLVFLCVFVGWIAWAMLLRILDPSKRKADQKIAMASKTVAELPDDHLCTEEVELRPPPTALTGLALLEHYGCFGASPGMWVTC